MSYHPIDSETIHTAAGDYIINWFHDESGEQPYNEGFTLITNGYRPGGRAMIDIETGDTENEPAWTVAQALSNHASGWDQISGAAIIRYLQLAGKKGVALVDTDLTVAPPSIDRQERVYGVAWAPDDAVDHNDYTVKSLQEWNAWANGETFGWQLIDPSGNEVDSCWGYFNVPGEKDYTLVHATEIAQDDAKDRAHQASLAGAGITGLI